MVIKYTPNAKLDKQVERYLANGVPLTDITNYSIERSAGQFTTLKLELVVDQERFDKEPGLTVLIGENGPEHVIKPLTPLTAQEADRFTEQEIRIKTLELQLQTALAAMRRGGLNATARLIEDMR